MGKEEKCVEIYDISDVSKANATIAVTFNGSRKEYHYGIKMVDSLFTDKKYFDAHCSKEFLVVRGSGIQNGSPVQIEKYYPYVTDRVERTADKVNNINFIFEAYEDFDYSGMCQVVTVGSVSTTQTKKTEKESDNMFDKIFKDAGKQLKGKFAISMLDQKEAVKLGDNWVTVSEDSKTVTDVTGMVVELDFMPGIVMPKLVSEVKKGDIIYKDGDLTVVTSKLTGGSIKTIDGNGDIKEVKPVGNAMMGGVSYILVLVNPMAMMNPTGVAVDATNPMGAMFTNPMMMMAFMGDSDSKSDDMFGKMMMMQAMIGMMPQAQTQAGAEG